MYLSRCDVMRSDEDVVSCQQSDDVIGFSLPFQFYLKIWFVVMYENEALTNAFLGQLHSAGKKSPHAC